MKVEEKSMKNKEISLIIVIVVCLTLLDSSFILTKLIASISIGIALYILIKDIKNGKKE